MDRDSVAASHLIEATIELHDRNRAEAADGSDDFVDFSDDEIRSMIRSLWVGRYSSNRREFYESVGKAVLRVVSE